MKAKVSRPKSQGKTRNGKAIEHQTEPQMKVVFFRPGVDFRTDSGCVVEALMEIPACLFEQVLAAAKDRDSCVGEFTANAIREKLGTRKPEPRFGWASELEQAREQSHALQMLLFDAMNNSDGTYCGDIQCGIVQLIAVTSTRLSNAVDGVSSLLKPAGV